MAYYSRFEGNYDQEMQRLDERRRALIDKVRQHQPKDIEKRIAALEDPEENEFSLEMEWVIVNDPRGGDHRQRLRVRPVLIVVGDNKETERPKNHRDAGVAGIWLDGELPDGEEIAMGAMYFSHLDGELQREPSLRILYDRTNSQNVDWRSADADLFLGLMEQAMAKQPKPDPMAELAAEAEERIYILSSGEAMTGDEIHEALLEQFRREDLQPGKALRWAQNNRLELKMLYQEVMRASHGGRLLTDPSTAGEAKKAIDHAHGEVLGETFANCVADIERMSAVALAALNGKFNEVESYYRGAQQQGKTVGQAFVKSPVLMAPHNIEGVTLKNFVQALTVASIVKWLPIRAYHDGKRFFVTPLSKDWNVIEMLENTPGGKDWIDMAFVNSEHNY